MPFQKGHKFSPGGKKGNKGGRPSNQDREIKRLARDYAKQYLEKRVNKVLDKYFQLAAKGIKRRKHHPKTGKVYYEMEYSDANQRHWIDKIVPTLGSAQKQLRNFWHAGRTV